MNKVSQLTLLLLPVLLLVTGCDFFRKLAGGPTSEDIAVMAEDIRTKEEEAEKARLAVQAAEEAARKRHADSLAAVGILSHEVLHTPERFGGVSAEVPYRYYIIIGSFSDKANAERLAGKMTAAGFPAVTVPFGNRLNGVGLCGTDDVVAIARSIEDVKRQDFCPAGVWILENIRK